MSLFVELQRRKVVRTTAAYLAAALIAALTLRFVSRALSLPHWIFETFVILSIVALPLVIGLAWAFDITPEGVEHTSSATVKVKWKRVGVPAIVSGMLMFLVLGFYTLNASEQAINDSLVAVLPFNAAGDAGMGNIGDRTADLLAARLTGRGGPKSADARLVKNALLNAPLTQMDDAAAMKLAHSVGAAQVLTGSVTRSAHGLIIHAQLQRANGDKVTAEVTTSADSLAQGVGQLTAELWKR